MLWLSVCLCVCSAWHPDTLRTHSSLKKIYMYPRRYTLKEVSLSKICPLFRGVTLRDLYIIIKKYNKKEEEKRKKKEERKKERKREFPPFSETIKLVRAWAH